MPTRYKFMSNPMTAAGDIIYGGASGAPTRLAKGTDGQVLTLASGNPSWATASGGGGEPEQIKGASTVGSAYSDDINNLAAYIAAGNSIYLLSNQLLSSCLQYKSGTGQSIAKTSLWADTDLAHTMVVGGYIYAFLIDNGVAAKVMRCAVTDDINNSANWVELTISGTALPTATNSGLVGYGDGKFWFADAGNSKLIPYTLSGTTLTSASDITITGATYEASRFRVNNSGIYCRFTSAPYIRLSAFDGTLNANKQFMSSDLAATFALSDTYYIFDSTHFVKID